MTIGPAPIIRILLMSVRFGISLGGYRRATSFHQAYKAVEQRPDILRAGASLRVSLEAERRPIGERKALQRAVEQRLVRHAHIFGECPGIDLEAVVLAGDHDVTGVEILHPMIRAMMSKLHLERFCAGGETEQLMAEADPEYRNAGIDNLAHRFDGVIAGLRIAGPV